MWISDLVFHLQCALYKHYRSEGTQTQDRSGLELFLTCTQSSKQNNFPVFLMYLTNLTHILLPKKKKKIKGSCITITYNTWTEEVACGKTIGHKNALKPVQVFPSKVLALFIQGHWCFFFFLLLVCFILFKDNCFVHIDQVLFENTVWLSFSRMHF